MPCCANSSVLDIHGQLALGTGIRYRSGALLAGIVQLIMHWNGGTPKPGICLHDCTGITVKSARVYHSCTVWDLSVCLQ